MKVYTKRDLSDYGNGINEVQERQKRRKVIKHISLTKTFNGIFSGQEVEGGLSKGFMVHQQL